MAQKELNTNFIVSLKVKNIIDGSETLMLYGKDLAVSTIKNLKDAIYELYLDCNQYINKYIGEGEFGEEPRPRMTS